MTRIVRILTGRRFGLSAKTRCIRAIRVLYLYSGRLNSQNGPYCMPKA